MRCSIITGLCIEPSDLIVIVLNIQSQYIFIRFKNRFPGCTSPLFKQITEL